MAQTVKRLSTVQETQVRSLGSEDPLEKEMAIHSNTIAWKTPWTVAYQAPPSMGFSRHEYWSGLLFPSPGDLPNLGIESRSPTLQADTLPSELPGKPLMSKKVEPISLGVQSCCYKFNHLSS